MKRVALTLLIAGGLLTWASSFVGGQVHDQLSQQNITMPAGPAIEGEQYAPLPMYSRRVRVFLYPRLGAHTPTPSRAAKRCSLHCNVVACRRQMQLKRSRCLTTSTHVACAQVPKLLLACTMTRAPQKSRSTSPSIALSTCDVSARGGSNRTNVYPGSQIRLP